MNLVEMLPREPVRQWVLSVPFPLRYLFATDSAAMGAVLGIAWRAISMHLVGKAGLRLATGRLALTAQGLVRYALKTPYRDGTTHGVLAPHSALRAQVTPAGWGTASVTPERSPADRHRAMSWA